MEEAKVTDLDHQGAVIWIDCPLCGADHRIDCVSLFRLGPDWIFVATESGKVHDARMKKWLEFKAMVVAGAHSMRIPNMQQIPRSEPYRISEGGSEEDKLYWERRNKLKPSK